MKLEMTVFRDDSLSGTELTSKLESAFLAGLRCNQPTIRQKFVEVINLLIISNVNNFMVDYMYVYIRKVDTFNMIN